MVWQRVTEDYAPFEINVTTEDPGVAALSRTSETDNTWGVRVAIGGSSQDWAGAYVGGLAHLNSFRAPYDSPVFVFSEMLAGGYEKFVANATSHEVGHALGLGHDGVSEPADPYYDGHGSGDTNWSPIMGSVGGTVPSQWSKGEYPGANNQQDDLAVITEAGVYPNNGFGYRVDDHSDTLSAASTLIRSGSEAMDYGIIETSDDIDIFSFVTDGGQVSLSVVTADHGPNLDILAELYDSEDHLIVASNPFALLSASIQTNISAGRYYLKVQGTGKAATTEDPGYTSYGSLGSALSMEP